MSLRQLLYKYYVGDTRGWIEVEKKLLIGILDFISTSSYENEEFIYLDEDIDFSFFVSYIGYMPELDKIYIEDDYFEDHKPYIGGLQ